MLKAILIAATLTVITVPTVFAQNMSSATGSGPNSTSKTGAAYAPQGALPGGTGPSSWADNGWGDTTPRTTQTTKPNGAESYRNPFGPQLPGDPSNSSGIVMGDSGAATGAPISMGGAPTYTAPANIALQTQYGAGARKLPKTRLDSFVFNAPNPELIYGDEGRYTVPPYFTFTEEHRIERGITSGGLTTGHKSDAPEAWGWPN